MPDFTVVIGPPAAGKSTYVREHARPGDIVIDFDELAQCLGSPVAHGHAEPHSRTASAAWLAAKQAALKTGANVWLVHANPSPQLERMYRTEGAHIITIDPGQATIRQRAHDRDPAQITEWYSRR